MRKIQEVLRLHYEHKMKAREAGAACGLGNASMPEHGHRAKAANLSWPLPKGLNDEALESLPFPPAVTQDAHRPLPDWTDIRSEPGKKGVTMVLVWQEYLEKNPSGYRYTRDTFPANTLRT